MNGQINDHPFAELSFEVAAAGLSGALRLTHERVKVVVYFEYGEIVFAVSNLRSHRLSETIRRIGTVADEHLAAIGDAVSDLELVEKLLAHKLIDESEVDRLWSRHVADIVRVPLLWTFGHWQFDPRARLTDGVRTTVEAQKIFTEGARRLSTAFVNSRFMNPNEMLRASARTTDNIGLQPLEAYILSRADAPIALADLRTVTGVQGGETSCAIYTLVVGGFLVRESQSHALPVAEVAEWVAKQPPKPVTAASSSSFDSLEDRQAEELRNEMAELGDYLRRLDCAEDLYSVLTVGRSATDDDIKQAYHSLAKRFHPDRFRKTGDSALLNTLEKAFARIAQSHETLRSSAMRTAYDLKLDQRRASGLTGSLSTEETGPLGFSTSFPSGSMGVGKTTGATGNLSRAELVFREAVAAMEAGNRNLAVLKMGEATRLEPNAARYHAFYGRALSAFEQSRRQAESELQLATTLDSKNPAYRVMLAELYVSLKFFRRAQMELKRALGLDGKYEPALTLLDQIENQLKS